MSTGYIKLFGSILDSTVWLEDLHVKVVWITMLAMSDRDGIVEGSIPGLAKRAGVTVEQCEEALSKFLSPDKYSRSREYDGRRVEVIDGGWRLLNREKYREKLDADDQREKAAARQRRKREREDRDMSRPVTGERDMSRDVRQTETETDQDLISPDLPGPELPDPRACDRAQIGAAGIGTTPAREVVREVVVVPAAPAPAYARTGYERPSSRPPNEHRAKLARDVVNYCALRHAELKGDGIDPTAPPIPIQHSPSDFGFNLLLDRLDELLAISTVDDVRDTMRRRVDVAIAECRRDRSLKYFALPRLFDPKSFAIAAAMSPEQAAEPRQRAGPNPRGTSSDSPIRRLKPA